MPEEKKKYRFKKLTYTHSKWGRYDSRGKSSKEKDAMIAEMRGALKALTSRIERFKWVISEKDKQLKEKDKTITRTRNERRDDVVKSIKKELLEKQKLRTKKYETTRRALSLKVENRDRRIAELTEEVRELKKEVSKLLKREDTLKRKLSKERLSLNNLKRQKSKEVKKVVPPGVKKLQTLLKKGYSERGLNYLDVSSKLSKKLDTYNLTATQYSILLQIKLSGNLNTSDLIVGNKKQVHNLKTKGYVNKTVSGDVTHGYSWFLTTRGEEIVDDINNYVSHGKSLLSI